MAKQSRAISKSNSRGHVVKSDSNSRVIKSSPAKTTLSKETIRTAVLSVRDAK